ncbi:hypothetical protein DIPPA_13690 [Diplonema papillatum]|nr:hypothetical protein DIPPA_13690 [Diplonema papillatum]|eukprot:gene17059-26172_t
MSSTDSWADTATVYQHFAGFTGSFAEIAAAEAVALWEQRRAAAPAATPPPPPPPAVRVLDIAAGTGVAAVAAAAELLKRDPSRPVRLLGTDLSPAMLEKFSASPALAKLQKDHPTMLEVETKQLDMSKLEGIPDGSVDIALFVFGLFFAPDGAAALREVKRVLAPGGVAAVVTWHFNEFIHQLGRVLVHTKHLKTVDEVMDLMGVGTQDTDKQMTLTRLFTEAGFAPVPTWTGKSNHTKPQVMCRFIQPDAVPLPAKYMSTAMRNPAFQKMPQIDHKEMLDFYVEDGATYTVDGEPHIDLYGTAISMYACAGR